MQGTSLSSAEQGSSTMNDSTRATEFVREKADRKIRFFLPYLRAGMRVLDGGRGAGWTTLGLAEAVRPGEVVGVDIDGGALKQAQTAADERKLTNVRFQESN